MITIRPDFGENSNFIICPLSHESLETKRIPDCMDIAEEKSAQRYGGGTQQAIQFMD